MLANGDGDDDAADWRMECRRCGQCWQYSLRFGLMNGKQRDQHTRAWRLSVVPKYIVGTYLH